MYATGSTGVHEMVKNSIIAIRFVKKMCSDKNTCSYNSSINFKLHAKNVINELKHLNLFRIKLLAGFVAVILTLLRLHGHHHQDPAFLNLLGLPFTHGSSPYHCYFYMI